jgi:hypothetical protein
MTEGHPWKRRSTAGGRERACHLKENEFCPGNTTFERVHTSTHSRHERVGSVLQHVLMTTPCVSGSAITATREFVVEYSVCERGRRRYPMQSHRSSMPTYHAVEGWGGARWRDRMRATVGRDLWRSGSGLALCESASNTDNEPTTRCSRPQTMMPSTLKLSAAISKMQCFVDEDVVISW